MKPIKHLGVIFLTVIAFSFSVCASRIDYAYSDDGHTDCSTVLPGFTWIDISPLSHPGTVGSGATAFNLATGTSVSNLNCVVQKEVGDAVLVNLSEGESIRMTVNDPNATFGLTGFLGATVFNIETFCSGDP